MFSMCFNTKTTKLQLSSLLPQRLLRHFSRRRWMIQHYPLLLLFTSLTIILICAYTYWTTNQLTFPANPHIVYTAGQMHSVQRIKLGPSTFSDPCVNLTSPLLVIVTSAPHHTAQRSAIRETWGGRAGELGVRLFYLIGEVSDNFALQEELYREHFTHGDLLQAAFDDTYFNLTLKSLAMMSWLDRTLQAGHCSALRYALKVDDDMFVNIEAIEKFARKRQNDNEEKFIGRLHSGDRPIRSRFNKYYLPEEAFPRTHFPDFVTGAAYLFSARSAGALYRAAAQNPEAAIFLEDVYVTGILPERLGNRIQRVDHPSFINWEVSVECRADFERIWTSHNVPPREMRRRWEVVRQEKSQLTCGQFWWGCS